MGIDKALVTTYLDNYRSMNVAIANGGVITSKMNERVQIWIDTNK